MSRLLKIFILLLFSSVAVKSQTLLPSTLPNPNAPSGYYKVGYSQANAFIFTEIDTFAAKYPTLIKHLNHQFYYTNGNGDFWHLFSSTSVSNISILNDSTILICSFSSCDTFHSTVVANYVTILNDSTLQVCDTDNNCDTLNIPKTAFSTVTLQQAIDNGNYLNKNDTINAEHFKLNIKVTSADSTRDTPGLTIIRGTDGGYPQIGLGSSLDFKTQIGRNYYLTNSLVSKITQSDSSIRSSDFILRGIDNGQPITDLATFNGDGTVKFNGYGVGNHAGTAIYWGGWDASGNFVELAPPTPPTFTSSLPLSITGSNITIDTTTEDYGVATINRVRKYDSAYNNTYALDPYNIVFSRFNGDSTIISFDTSFGLTTLQGAFDNGSDLNRNDTALTDLYKFNIRSSSVDSTGDTAILTLQRDTRGTPQAGLGGTIDFRSRIGLYDYLMNRISSRIISADSSIRGSEFVFSNADTIGVLNPVLTLHADRSANLNAYGVGNYISGSPAYTLGVNSDGKIVETSNPTPPTFTADLPLSITGFNITADTITDSYGLATINRVRKYDSAYVSAINIDHYTQRFYRFNGDSTTLLFDSIPINLSQDTTFSSIATDSIPSMYAAYWFVIHHSGGGGGVTARNGLTDSSSTILLGGTLYKPTTITSSNAASNIIIDGSSGLAEVAQLIVQTSGTGRAIQGAVNGSGGTGILGSSVSGTGIQASNTGSGQALYAYGSQGNGYGVYGRADSNYSGLFIRKRYANNTVLSSILVSRVSSVASADGIGVGIDMSSQTSGIGGGGFTSVSNTLISKWTTSNQATRTSQFQISGYNNATQYFLTFPTLSADAYSPLSVNGNFADAAGNITIATGGGSALVKQTHTSGATVTVADSTTWLVINPATLLAALTVTLPASPTDGQVVDMSFGGTINATATAVVTSFTVSPNSGQGLVGTGTYGTVITDDHLAWQYNSTNSKWYVH